MGRKWLRMGSEWFAEHGKGCEEIHSLLEGVKQSVNKCRTRM